ncbi:sugar ABC transporter substrate-binding protein [Clostridium lacusfryxellense]|uniref:sugar ABC transporter substrate-binding protein n=1 Tax=Clostridium lacusfryxellense TaxID=205328 RepID=UPI001C0DE53F|nr:sugar ABC transporter substrate-binding protein [Clostridium lacusfryxellense]MBU3109993.1 sugar ABC transporter substrate-binding protein [Clostridium lacusfryxellense]
MYKKLISVIIFSVFVSAALLGCSKVSSSKTTTNLPVATSEKKNILLIMKTLTNPFFIEMEKGARQAESEYGIKLTVKTGAKETSIEQQIALVEDAITSKVDAIVISPGSSTELIPVLKKAQDAKIPIVNIDNRLDPDLSKKKGLVNVPFISVDNKIGGYLSAKYISDKIKKPTKAIIIEGIRGADNGEQRKQGAIKAFAENKNITLVDQESANWNIDEGYSVAKKLFDENHDIGAIFCANDMMALGVIQYLDENNPKEDVLIAGFDALSEAKTAITDGKMSNTIDQQAIKQGYTGVKIALDLINGKKPTNLVTLVDVKVINLNNVK